MSVDSTLMMKEVSAIQSSGESNSHWRIGIRILVGGVWLTPVRMEFYHLHRDYASGFSDERTIEFLIGLGDYQFDIVPNRDTIQVDVTYTPLDQNTSEVDAKKRTETVRYRGILKTQSNQALSNKNSQARSKEALNQVNGAHSVAMQLITEPAYRMLMTTWGKIYRQGTTMECLRSVYTEVAERLGGSDQVRILGQNVVEGWNKENRRQISLPDGILVKDIPQWLQQKEGGVYATGLSRYLQDQYWYIFPTFDTTRYRKNVKSLVIINVPNDKAQGSERTYKTAEQHVTIIATGDASSLDRGLTNNLNEGNGLRFGDVTKLLGDFGVSKDNRALVDRASNVYEVMTEKLKTGVNNIRWAAERATSNPFKYYSQMAERKGQALKLQWTHGDSDLLYPGMPVKFMTVNGINVETYYGVLLGVDEQRAPSDNSANPTRYPGIVTLAVFLNRFEGDSDPDAVAD